MSNPLKNSIWPNLDGQLGKNKVAIPDGINDLWPDGDALVGNFVYKNGKVVGLVDSSALIANSSNTTTFPYDFVHITLNETLRQTLTINKGERCKSLIVDYKNNLPKGFKMVDYLESVDYQFISTGLTTTNDTGLRAKWMWCTSSISRGNQHVLSGGGAYLFRPRTANSVWNAQAEFGKVTINVTPIKRNVMYDCSVNWKNSLIATINGEIHSLEGASQSTNTIQVQLFAYNNNTNVYGFTGRIYSAQVTRGEEIVRDFIPCLDDTGTPCMFDIITENAFYNKGTGDFLYPVVESPITLANLDEKFYAKLTENGVRRLYKVPEGCFLSKEEYANLNGFKEIVEIPMPKDGNWIPLWRETDSQIICEWIVSEG